MSLFYPLKNRCKLIYVLLFLFIGISVSAALPNNPFESVFETAKISKEDISRSLPHLWQVVSKEDYSIADINTWVSEFPKEWKSFNELPEIKKLNIAWVTLGIKVPAAEKIFQHSLYQWYKASGISDEKKKQLFPHFPLPDLRKDYDQELSVYEQKVGTWQRLYPEEYEHFLNAPEMTALNPYYTGYYTLPYLPRFIGQAIELNKPHKKDSGNPVMDDYNYQLQLRNWYFVFKPDEFNRLYGKDYKFPDSFDTKTYREYTIRILKETKAGTYPNNDNAH